VRPTYAITEQFKLVTEFGHDQVRAADGTRKLSKFTCADLVAQRSKLLGTPGNPLVLHLRELERRRATCGQ
jgi:maltoporin